MLNRRIGGAGRLGEREHRSFTAARPTPWCPHAVAPSATQSPRDSQEREDNDDRRRLFRRRPQQGDEDTEQPEEPPRPRSSREDRGREDDNRPCSRDNWQSRDSRESRDGRDSRDSRDGRESGNGRDSRDNWQSRDSRDSGNGRDSRDSRDSRQSRDGRNQMDSRDGRDNRENRDSNFKGGWGGFRRPVNQPQRGSSRDSTDPREEADEEQQQPSDQRQPPPRRPYNRDMDTLERGRRGLGRSAYSDRPDSRGGSNYDSQQGPGGSRGSRDRWSDHRDEPAGPWQTLTRDPAAPGDRQQRGRPAGQGSWDGDAPGWEGANGPQGSAGAVAQPAEVQAPPARPPRMPVVRPRLDLAIVRADDQDKGTFFAPGARFDELGLTKDVVDALRTLGIKRPSHVQSAALQAWRGDSQHIAIADQAGSGKTLAYLLPLIQAIRSQDLAMGKPATQPRCPRAIVVAPTTELVQQVYRVAKSISNAGARLRVACITGGQSDERERARTSRTQREMLDQGVDLVVATPGRLVELVRAGHLDLAACRGLVLDEVDVLLGDTAAFEAQMAPLRELAPPSLRFVLVTATLPQHTADALQQSFKDIRLASGPGLHRTAAGLVEELVDCSGGEEVTLESGIERKLDALWRVLRTHKAPRALVFCNKIEACRDVENYLRKKCDTAEAQVLVYHEAIREDMRQAAMNAFLSPVGQEGEALAHLKLHAPSRRQADPTAQGAGAEGDATAAAAAATVAPAEASSGSRGSGREAAAGPPRLVLVATDRMSRGIDCMHCQHVVLFDFPRDPSEYVRRVGRTARGAGGTGVVSSLVLGRQVALAREIMGRNEKGQPVHRLPRL